MFDRGTGYWLNEVENLEISKKMTDILHINRINEKSIENRNLTERDAKINQNKIEKILHREYNEKCLSARYFLLGLKLKNQINIEIIFFVFSDFKIWVKNLDYVIKNQYKLLSFKK